MPIERNLPLETIKQATDGLMACVHTFCKPMTGLQLCDTDETISHKRENWCVKQISVFISSPVETQNISSN